jgi:light-independent protochlorophyllide reductase subunit B
MKVVQGQTAVVIGASGGIGAAITVALPADFAPEWAGEAEQELRKIPFFVRGKARRNTERFAREHGVAFITIETLYDAKAHFGR